MNWAINRKRVVREPITAGYCGCASRWGDADTDPWSADFNSALQEQSAPCSSFEVDADSHEDIEDIRDARSVITEAGQPADYEDFRRELGLE